MVRSDFAVLRKTILRRSVYSGKQRNIYEHIYKFISPFTENPP